MKFWDVIMGRDPEALEAEERFRAATAARLRAGSGEVRRACAEARRVWSKTPPPTARVDTLPSIPVVEETP